MRDGTYYLLQLYHSAGNRWMAHRDPGDSRQPSDYNLIHKPWTGLSGVRRRVVEPTSLDTYGAVFRESFPAPANR